MAFHKMNPHGDDARWPPAPQDNLSIIKELFDKNKLLPHGGPRVFVLAPDCFFERNYYVVGDGSFHYGMFASAIDARRALSRAGFRSHHMTGGKLEEVYWHTY